MMMGKINRWSEEETKFLLENYKKFKCVELAKIMQRTERAIQNKAWELKITDRQPAKMMTNGNPIKLKLKENEKIIAVKMVILLDEIKKNLRNANDIDLSLPKLRSVFVKIENSRSWSDETLQRSTL